MKRAYALAGVILGSAMVFNVAANPGDVKVVHKRRNVPTQKAIAFQKLVEQHSPFEIEVLLTDDADQGRSIVELRGDREVVFTAIQFVELLAGRTKTNNAIERDLLRQAAERERKGAEKVSGTNGTAGY